MSSLPPEIWIQILDYLGPTDVLSVQQVSRRLSKIARDPALWRAKCFEKAPSAVHAFNTGDSLSELLNSLSLTPPTTDSQNDASHPSTIRKSRRAQAIVNWDCTHPDESVDWYSDYIARHAPLSTEWLDRPFNNEIRSIALFENDTKILGAMEDGSLRIWDVNINSSGRRSFHHKAQSNRCLLSENRKTNSRSSSALIPNQSTVGSAVDSTLVKSCGKTAYIAVDDCLNEVDLETMKLLSQHKDAWKITAISQQSSDDIPLMIGTSFTLHIHDPRMPLQHQATKSDKLVDVVDQHQHQHQHQHQTTVFLPNYSKATMHSPDRNYTIQYPLPSLGAFDQRPDAFPPQSPLTQPLLRRRADLEVFAAVEPGPQTILHRGSNEILVAGRMPSVLLYDKRKFPQLQSVIHSGARLSSLATLPYPPHESSNKANSSTTATLIAAGEYHGRGSLELYELPHHHPTDKPPTYDWPTSTNEDETPPTSSSIVASTTPTPPSSSDTAPTLHPPYSYRNRQSSSAAKILSVVPHGTRILFSDSEGNLKWVERNGRGLARRWNINTFEYGYSHTAGQVVSEAAARKLLTFASDTPGSSTSATSGGATKGDGDILFWTGADIGLVTSKVKWTGHDELVAAFEERLTLEDSEGTSGSSGRNGVDTKRQEEEYSRTMRRALERQADERRFLARFGTRRW